ncbi:MAG: hypothetical protein KDB14_18070 [Planctomycetales bacterium]|nr:hypothetical protein [Planctomycetales bacterium]
MKRMILGLAAAIALMVATASTTQAADFYFGISSGGRAYSPYGSPYSVGRVPVYSGHHHGHSHHGAHVPSYSLYPPSSVYRPTNVYRSYAPSVYNPYRSYYGSPYGSLHSGHCRY